MGTGTKTQFSGFGNTPTGELIVLACQRLRIFLVKTIPNERLDTRFLTFFDTSVDSDVYRLVGCCFLRIEILDESRIGVEVGPC